MKLALPLEELSRYYKLSIADYAMSKDTIVLHIKIPITQVISHRKSYELLATPYGWQNDTCVLMHELTYLAVSHLLLERAYTCAGPHDYGGSNYDSFIPSTSQRVYVYSCGRDAGAAGR